LISVGSFSPATALSRTRAPPKCQRSPYPTVAPRGMATVGV
jgi:hypothetical protein